MAQVHIDCGGHPRAFAADRRLSKIRRIFRRRAEFHQVATIIACITPLKKDLFLKRSSPTGRHWRLIRQRLHVQVRRRICPNFLRPASLIGALYMNSSVVELFWIAQGNFSSLAVKEHGSPKPASLMAEMYMITSVVELFWIAQGNFSSLAVKEHGRVIKGIWCHGSRTPALIPKWYWAKRFHFSHIDRCIQIAP